MALKPENELLRARIEYLEERLAIVRTESLEEAAGLAELTAAPDPPPGWRGEVAAAWEHGAETMANEIVNELRDLITKQENDQ